MSKLFLLVLLGWLLISQPLSAQLIAGVKIASATRLKDFKGKTFAVKPVGKSVAYIFLSTECPLCRNYAPVLEALQNKHPDVQFYGIISGATFARSEVATFTKDYGITFPVLMDPAKHLSTSLHATVTPEVILIGSNGKEHYRGLIDDWVVGLGKTRKVASKKYLEQAINNLETGGEPLAATKPIGCLISNF
ncbi:Thiol-disulfide isomerase or thioredoxin [Chitinophaga sp. CF118]|uniref:redoxin family protein n=1 Tax=Chitinophaga sp. CF118 TaxID=1884367 RepID=UPI0008EB832E|nr:redoxin family protein [Chitinophaga sp. CF118]SFE14111.1 Thiol-disulfide isomerase or thioredoxin [Chitinophaga sp. CF118]